MIPLHVFTQAGAIDGLPHTKHPISNLDTIQVKSNCVALHQQYSVVVVLAALRTCATQPLESMTRHIYT